MQNSGEQAKAQGQTATQMDQGAEAPVQDGGVPSQSSTEQAGASTAKPNLAAIAVATAVALVVVYGIFQGWFGTKVTPARLAGTWECDGQGRPMYEFDPAGTYTQSTIGDPNSSDSAKRASMEVKGTFAISGGEVTMTPKRVLAAVEPQDLPLFAPAMRSGAIRLLGSNTFEILPGQGSTTMSAKLSDKTLTFRVTRRVDARGSVVNPPAGAWQPFECTKG
ncbi:MULTISPECIES: hypothetical protein [unclassified Variovorax]|uniref:hypothetical protein n=1 Tax=unclassified Variovorax TaxID=663243 RepID=UPI00022A685D|nr:MULTISPECIES: hypothetical protein [unclassified Variovorax]AEO20121.1 hypothetical protein VASRS_46 [Variovorax sp. SRS16]VTU42678.1 hypothetical protein SRS16P1_00330 [Variovorax sp. SRS16]VTU42706.1 hypothetical protein E5P1_00328 [Variovorax sp. PBL-E5]VTU43842.1 hypothetical protein H6P1_00600 [Variovorax sp. PBL-H6]